MMRVFRSVWLRAVIFIVLFVSLAVFGLGNLMCSKSIPLFEQSSNNAGFVTRSGTRLMLNGEPFRFEGANMHWLGLGDFLSYPSQFRVNDAFDVAREMGLTVIRSHELGISTRCTLCIEPSLGVFNEKALEQIDYVINAASKHNLRLIIPLTDNWHFREGGKHNFTDWRGIQDENQFYYNPQVISDFETYIRVLLNHVNIYTGIPYKDDPTILAWETGNELQPPTSWTQTISTFIKSIDHHHLVIDGREGIDPNAAGLTNVDILSDHYYPKSISQMNIDARAASRAGKAFIVGEFDWNDVNGGDTLSSFLAAVTANPEVAGAAFWELWSHDDEYGYVSGDEYTLHYPGDTLDMRRSAQLLRSYAYKIMNRLVPTSRIPGAPMIQTVIRNGSSNTVIWRGTAVAASYSIERSIGGANGPWTVICNKCATDNNSPWMDTDVPAGPLWYRVTPYNVSGIAGPASNSYQAGSAGIMIDNLNDWSHVYQHSSNLIFDTTYAQFMNGDASRVIRTTSAPEFITWRQTHIVSFQAVAYFWPYEPVSHFSFYTSQDGIRWQVVTPQVIRVNGDWEEYIYTLQDLPDVNYVKIVWNNINGQPWNPNLGTVSLLY